MKSALYAILIICCCNIQAFCENSIPTAQECKGKWTLTDASGWAVYNEEGTIFPLSFDTVVLGCSKKPVTLKEKYSGASVAIFCTPSPTIDGLPTVTKVIIICK